MPLKSQISAGSSHGQKNLAVKTVLVELGRFVGSMLPGEIVGLREVPISSYTTLAYVLKKCLVSSV